MKIKINKCLRSIFLLITLSTNLYADESAIEDLVVFNTQEVMFHQPIPSLLYASHDELLAEPSMKQATSEFAWEVGGPITRDILSNFKEILNENDYKNMRIDTKFKSLIKMIIQIPLDGIAIFLVLQTRAKLGFYVPIQV